VDLVRRERDPRRRRERYIIDDDLWLRSWMTDAQRHATWAGTAQQGAEILGAATPAGARLDDMSQFFAQLAGHMGGGDGVPITAANFEDALTVTAALIYAHAPLTADQLAVALDWPAERVANALHDAEHYPIADPVTLQRSKTGTYTISARLDRLSATQRQALSPSSGSRDLLA
jgi:hypothetical protein